MAKAKARTRLLPEGRGGGAKRTTAQVRHIDLTPNPLSLQGEGEARSAGGEVDVVSSREGEARSAGGEVDVVSCETEAISAGRR